MHFISTVLLIFTFLYSLFIPTHQANNSGIYRHDITPDDLIELAKHPQFNAVGLIIKNGKPKATGVLISSRWVLMAAHSLDLVSQSNNIKFRIGGTTYTAIKHFVATQYEDHNKNMSGDIALIKLDNKVTRISPATIYYDRQELHHEAYTVGYGTTQDALFENEVIQDHHLRAGTNIIDSIGGTPDDHFKNDELLCDLDAPSDTTINNLGDTQATTYETIMNGGDSGGGLFIKDNQNNWFVAGIASTTHIDFDKFDTQHPSHYGTIASWIRVSDYTDWIVNTIENN
jgi:secreted trypsin-like serine protease